MKHLKLFEGFFHDVINHYGGYEDITDEFKKEISKIIKDEIDIYMYDILDEYQSENSDNELVKLLPSIKHKDTKANIILGYRDIFVEYKYVKDFLEKLKKVVKILKNKYNLYTTLYWYFIEEDGVYRPMKNGLEEFIKNFESGVYPENCKFRFTIYIIDKKYETPKTI